MAYTPRNISPADQILFDSTGKAVGIQPAASSSPPVLGFNPTKHAAIDYLVSRAGIVASDTGSAWLGAPSLLSFSAVLDSGTTTAVLLEVRDAAGTVATAATITADTVAQVLRQAILLRQQSEYRFRRVSGTGNVTITV